MKLYIPPPMNVGLAYISTYSTSSPTSFEAFQR
jgi:hypothetical protein